MISTGISEINANSFGVICVLFLLLLNNEETNPNQFYTYLQQKVLP